MTASFPALPDRIKELGELASDLWWSWHYRARDLFRRLDYTLWRSSAHNPVAMLRQISPERLEAVSHDRAFLALYDDAVRDHRVARASPRILVEPHARRGGQGHDRVLLGRVRAASVAAHLRGRPRRARGRLLQGSERPRHAVCRRRVHVPAGVLPPESHGRRLAGRNLRDHRLGRHAHATGPQSGRFAVHRVGAARHADRPRRGVAGPGRARCASSCWTPTSRRTRRGTAGCRRASTGATRTCGSSRKSSSALAASGRSRRWASSPPSGT